LAAVVSGKSLNGWVAEQLQAAVERLGAIKAAGKNATTKTKAVRVCRDKPVWNRE